MMRSSAYREIKSVLTLNQFPERKSLLEREVGFSEGNPPRKLFCVGDTCKRKLISRKALERMRSLFLPIKCNPERMKFHNKFAIPNRKYC